VVWWKKKETISPGYAYIGREARNAADWSSVSMPAMAGTILATDRREKRKAREGKGRGWRPWCRNRRDREGEGAPGRLYGPVSALPWMERWRRLGKTEEGDDKRDRAVSDCKRERHSGLFSTAEMGCGPGKEGVRARVGGDRLARLGPWEGGREFYSFLHFAKDLLEFKSKPFQTKPSLCYDYYTLISSREACMQACLSEHGRRKKKKKKIGGWRPPRRDSRKGGAAPVEKKVTVVWAGGEEGTPQKRQHLVKPLELLLDRLRSYSAVCAPSPLPTGRPPYVRSLQSCR
jgi:hypothetical protein